MTTLLDLLPMHEPIVSHEATLLERAQAFHEANPKVYRELRRLSLQLVERGHRHFGVKMLIEQMRWTWYERTVDVSGFKINNSYASFYARLLAENEPELTGVFTMRTSMMEGQ